MCEYCENLSRLMTDYEYGYGIESEQSGSDFAHIARDPESNRFFFEIDNSVYYTYEIHFCPMCGRKLKEDNSNELPLSPGDEVWYVDVDADTYLAEHGKIEYISIESGTMIDYASVKFDDGDIDDFGPNGFGKYYFKTEEDAKKAWEAAHE